MVFRIENNNPITKVSKQLYLERDAKNQGPTRSENLIKAKVHDVITPLGFKKREIELTRNFTPYVEQEFSSQLSK